MGSKSQPTLPASSRMQMPKGLSQPMTAPKKAPLKGAGKKGTTKMKGC